MAFGDRFLTGRNCIVTGSALTLIALLAAAVSGCAGQQSPPSQLQAQSQSQSQAQMFIEPKVVEAPAHPLPFKGRLVEGDPQEVPPAIAMSLSSTSPVTFTYREELTHDDYHVPLIVSALDPANLVGAPLGEYGVTAFASLSITDGEQVLGDYTAKEHVSKSYNLYSQPTHKELEDAARAAVRQKIDQKLYDDENRLAGLAANSGKSSTAPADR
jgi:hypothetical protein